MGVLAKLLCCRLQRSLPNAATLLAGPHSFGTAARLYPCAVDCDMVMHGKCGAYEGASHMCYISLAFDVTVLLHYENTCSQQQALLVQLKHVHKIVCASMLCFQAVCTTIKAWHEQWHSIHMQCVPGVLKTVQPHLDWPLFHPQSYSIYTASAATYKVATHLVTHLSACLLATPCCRYPAGRDLHLAASLLQFCQPSAGRHTANSTQCWGFAGQALLTSQTQGNIHGQFITCGEGAECGCGL